METAKFNQLKYVKCSFLAYTCYFWKVFFLDRSNYSDHPGSSLQIEDIKISEKYVNEYIPADFVLHFECSHLFPKR